MSLDDAIATGQPGRRTEGVQRAPIAWRVTTDFWVTVGAWSTAVALFDMVLRARGGAAVLHWAPLVRAFAGPIWLVAATWGLGLASSMIVHEAGHALMARRVGARNVWVVIGALHGRTGYELDDPYSGRRAAVVAAGALAPLVAAPLLAVPHLAAPALVGCGLAVVNLVPAPMSDGGHLVAVVVHRLARGRRWADDAVAAAHLTMLTGAFTLAAVLQLGWLFAVSAPLLVLTLGLMLRSTRTSVGEDVSAEDGAHDPFPAVSRLTDAQPVA